MKPEDKARQKIERLLNQWGWIVQDHGELNISAVLIRGLPLLGLLCRDSP
jgi:hypothetical protein